MAHRFLVCCSALVLLASPAFAQSQSAAAPSQSQSTPPDFMLGRPHVSIGVKGSWFMASADGGFYDTVTKTLTLEKSNFRGPERDQPAF